MARNKGSDEPITRGVPRDSDFDKLEEFDERVRNAERN